MLIYHPAYDAYHAIFRALLILDALRSLEVEKLRLLDFYLVFPAELRHVRLPRTHRVDKLRAEKLLNVYRGPVNGMQAFRDMEPIQLAAIRALAASTLIDPAQLEKGHVIRTQVPVPADLTDPIRAARSMEQMMSDYVLGKLAEIPLRGTDGLKERTRLMEYRYDVA
jgi:hypothetical protein